jgi:hypothetical protein
LTTTGCSGLRSTSSFVEFEGLSPFSGTVRAAGPVSDALRGGRSGWFDRRTLPRCASYDSHCGLQSRW